MIYIVVLSEKQPVCKCGTVYDYVINSMQYNVCVATNAQGLFHPILTVCVPVIWFNLINRCYDCVE